MKNIKWGNKELPGLSHDDLANLTYTKIVAAETMRANRLKTDLRKNGIKGGTTQGRINAKNGNLEKARQVEYKRRAAEARKSYIEILKTLPNPFKSAELYAITSSHQKATSILKSDCVKKVKRGVYKRAF